MCVCAQERSKEITGGEYVYDAKGKMIWMQVTQQWCEMKVECRIQ